MKKLTVTLTIFILFFCIAIPVKAKKSNFVTIKLQKGLLIEVPRNWWLISGDLNKTIETAVEAVVDLSGFPLSDTNKQNIFSANSMPKSTYASIRVDIDLPATFALHEIMNTSEQELKTVDNIALPYLKKVGKSQGWEILDYFGTEITYINGFPAYSAKYRRTGVLKGPVLVEIIQLACPEASYRITLAYRESEAVLWKAVIAKIRNSITIQTSKSKLLLSKEFITASNMTAMIKQKLEDLLAQGDVKMRRENLNIPKHVIDSLNQHLMSSMLDSISGPNGLTDRYAAIYAKYFSKEQIEGLINFYQDPLWIKFNSGTRLTGSEKEVLQKKYIETFSKTIGLKTILEKDITAITQEWQEEILPRLKVEMDNWSKQRGYRIEGYKLVRLSN